MTFWNIALYFLIIATLRSDIRNNFVTGHLQNDGVIEQKPNVCTKPECYLMAQNIKSNMNRSVDPCDNFYQFVCGNYEKHTDIPVNEDYIDSFVEVTHLVKKQLRSLFAVSVKSDDNKLSRISKSLFQSCLDENGAIRKKYKDLRTKLGAAGFDWPILYRNTFDDVNFTWIQSVDVFIKANMTYNNFFHLEPRLSYPDGTRDVALTIPEVSHHQYYLSFGFENKGVEEYLKFMTDIALILGAPQGVVKKECRDIVKFEIELSKIVISAMNAERYNNIFPSYMTFGELKQNHTAWKDYFAKMDPYVGDVDDRNVITMRYYSHISSLLSLLDSTPKRTIANYIIWKTFDDEKLEDFETPLTVFNEFLKVVVPEEASPLSRVDLCVNQATSLVSTTALYASNFIGEDVKEEVTTILTAIQNRIVAALQKNNWIEPKERLSAVERINNMKSIIGYPDDILNGTVIDQYYDSLELDSNDYFGNLIKLKFIAKQRYSFGRSKEENSYLVTGTNAYFHSDDHQISILGGVLQGIFYNKEFPQYLNYAGIGSVIAHEIIHNFDTNNWGRYGGLYKYSLDERKTVTDLNYRQRVECLTNQYNNYFVPEIGKYINGTQTRDENIADNGGFKMAYSAYERWASEHEAESELPGLPYNPFQLYWISAASHFCGKFKPNILNQWALHGPHTPNEFRVIGSFSNYDDFAIDFDCPLGSNMNPVEKCELW